MLKICEQTKDTSAATRYILVIKAPHSILKVTETLITVKAPVFTEMGMRAQKIYGQTDNDRQEKKDHLVLVVCHSKFPRHTKTQSLMTMFTDSSLPSIITGRNLQGEVSVFYRSIMFSLSRCAENMILVYSCSEVYSSSGAITLFMKLTQLR